MGEQKKIRSEMLDQAIRESERAQQGYEQLTESQKNEYGAYIESAEQQATKQERIKKVLPLIERGAGLND